jgi:hypothetical protein
MGLCEVGWNKARTQQVSIFRLHERKKVDGSLTCCSGSESDRELSGAGGPADLYSSFGVQRNSRDLCSSKRGGSFSGTDPRRN